MRSRRRGAIVLVGLSLVAAACSATEAAVPPAATVVAPTTAAPTTTEEPTTTTTAAPPTTIDPRLTPVAKSLTAVPKGKVQGYDGPDGKKTKMVDDQYYDRPTKLAVIEQQDDWVHVRLAPKPNGSTVWLRQQDVTMGETPWMIIIDLAATHLRLYKNGELLMDAPVGIGTSATPTATGDFFMTYNQAPANSSYGPFVMITSGHSNVLQSWEGFPDGILAIHGPIGSDGMIADTGAAISNGCIRMHVADQQRLADVTPGSPIRIV